MKLIFIQRHLFYIVTGFSTLDFTLRPLNNQLQPVIWSIRADPVISRYQSSARGHTLAIKVQTGPCGGEQRRAPPSAVGVLGTTGVKQEAASGR